MNWRAKKYNWIIERARNGEPVPIDTDRPDIQHVLDFLREVDGKGLSIQMDNSHNLMWIVRTADAV